MNDHIPQSPVENSPAYELVIQRAANRELLREIADLKMKHDYQVRRADSAEQRVFELRAELEDTVTQLNDKLDELGLIKHILVEVGNGRFQKVDKPLPNSAAFIPSLPEGSNAPVPAGPSPMSSDRDVIWPSIGRGPNDF